MFLLGLSLREMNQRFKFVGTIGYGDSYLEFLFRHFNLFRLHAILNDAAGAVRAHSGKSPGYCYMIGRGFDWTTLSPLRKTLTALHFNSVEF